MKRILVSTLFVVCSGLTYAAPLMPGAQVIYLPIHSHLQQNNLPSITGKILNGDSKHVLTATNYIKVPNQFPKTIAGNQAANYSVSPLPPASGYEQWTNPIKYAYADHSGCYIQFAWDPIHKTTAIALSSIIPAQQPCLYKWSNPNGGTFIKICPEDESC